MRHILDAVGWRDCADLSNARLLEPAAGDGAFVVEAARRLAVSLRRRGVPRTVRELGPRIRAYELHPGETARARGRVAAVLRAAGVHHATARACARAWVVCADFLLESPPDEVFTHAVGNPPYVRWSKIPLGLKAQYDRLLPRSVTGGDLFLPFLHRALSALEVGGRCGLLCSDRWRYMQFAEAFRSTWLPRLRIASERAVGASDAFEREVDAYATVLVATVCPPVAPAPNAHGMRAAKAAPHAATSRAGRDGESLADLGCVIRVGPALGHAPAFVLAPDEDDVEPELLRPWVDAAEISEGTVAWSGRRVVTMHDADGRLVDLAAHPRLAARLGRLRRQLVTRSIVQRGAPWYRTIDRVRAADWTRPKLLVPELAKVPRCAVDHSGAIPSHGVYAIFAPDDDVEALYARLGAGRLGRALEGIAPRVKGGYLRCYRRFLAALRVDPQPSSRPSSLA